MFTGRRVELAQDEIPVQLKLAPGFATLDYQIEALHRHDQLKRLTQPHFDSHMIFLPQIFYLSAVLAINRFYLGALASLIVALLQPQQMFPAEVIVVTTNAGEVSV